MKKRVLYIFSLLCIFTLAGCSNEVKISNKDIEFIYNENAYVVESNIDDVDIVLSGDKTDIELAKKSGRVVANLSKLEKDETKNVILRFESDVKGIRVKIEPSRINVTLKEKLADKFKVDYTVVNDDELDSKLNIGSVELSKEEVIVKGSKDTLNKIDSVKALIDISVLDIHDVGEYSLDEVELVAYDDKGKVVEDAQIVGKVNAKFKIDSYSKTVPIKIVLTGDLIPGKVVSSILVNGKSALDYTLMIYGDEAKLESISYIPITIDVKDQGNNESKKVNVIINKPVGVRALSESKVSVELNFGEARQKEVTISGIKVKNLANGLRASLVSSTDNNVEVQVIGANEVLDNLDLNSINAYVDLEGYDVGTHTVDVKLESNDSRLQFIVNKKINISITKM